MVCFKPLKAYRKAGGGVTFSGKDAIPAAFLQLPCGQCMGCRVRRSREWALRCVHEAKMHERNSFLTLTYSPSKLPEDGSLRVMDLQRFWKRLRAKVVSGARSYSSFRYFACGEYGDSNLRPHYHACLFGIDFSSDRVLMRENASGALYYSKVLEDTWSNGFCTIGNLTYSSAAYVARYVMKKATGRLAEDRYLRFNGETGEYWNVKPEFVVMSRRPGVGSSWFSKWSTDVYPSDEVVFDGKRFRPPRFYDNKLESAVLAELKDKRARRMRAVDHLYAEDSLKVREEFDSINSGIFQKRGL